MTRRSRHSPIALLLTLAAGLPGAALHAQQQDTRTPPPAEVIRFDALVVTATRMETRLRDVPANVTVTTKQDIRLSPAGTVADVLRAVPGFNMRTVRSSVVAHPGRQGINMRGLGSSSASRTLVLVDGAPLVDPFNGWVYWNRIPLETIERIEVVRGGGSPTWGNRALGGVVNIIRTRPTRSGGYGTLQYGSNAMVRANGGATVHTDRFTLSADGGWFDTDGYQIIRSDLRGPIDARSFSQNETFGGRLTVRATQRLELGMTGDYFNEERRDGSPLALSWQEIGSLRGHARYTAGANEFIMSVFGGSQTYRQWFSSITADRTSETLSVDQYRVPATTRGMSVHWANTDLGRHSLAAGADLQTVEGSTNENFRYVAGTATRQRHAGGEQLLGGAYIQDVFRPIDGLQLTGSLRYDLWKSTAGVRRERNLETGQETLNRPFEELTRHEATYSLGARWNSSDRLSWRASTYTGFRAPTLNEQYRPFRGGGNEVNESNAALVPEHLVGAEAGIDIGLGSRLFTRLTGYWNRVDDPIVDATIARAGPAGSTIAPCGFVASNGVCRQRMNVGRFRSIGLEAEAELRAGADWTLVASYLYNPTKVTESPDSALIGKAQATAPKHSLFLQAAWSRPGVLDAALSGRYIGERFDDDLNVFVLEAAFVLDARVSRRVRRDIDVFAGVENLFDTEYETNESTNNQIRTGVPRLVHIGVRWVR